MLPVVICDPRGTSRSRWMDVVATLAHSEYPSLRLELLAGAERELRRTLDAQRGIILVLLSITEAAEDGTEGCIALFQRAMDCNRDNYVLLLLEDSAQLASVLSRCMRPAGVLIPPLREELMCASLRRVFSDFLALHGEEDDGDYMIVTVDKTMQRIAYRDILYFEAQNKMLNICMSRHVLTVRASLNELEKGLPKDFLRCHRSYIVNTKWIESFNVAEMMLELRSQERLPVSRSYRDVFRNGMKGGIWK